MAQQHIKTLQPAASAKAALCTAPMPRLAILKPKKLPVFSSSNSSSSSSSSSNTENTDCLTSLQQQQQQQRQQQQQQHRKHRLLENVAKQRRASGLAAAFSTCSKGNSND
eukprot:CAMPEP_0172779764 /NCGR_PEP_ID=MMETSP1074-20121228/202586_1 /TAXON_ID=2916 /ORGANISM="Ceratium fusus, Strain PA161109" /LENGTH=109 /DNA_ID=CAMNT_0013616729 /DNA_START=288 /DNA_END=617 /DNA_ORIENTATION=-